MAGQGLTLQEITDDELRGMAQSIWDRVRAIERQQQALEKELHRLDAQADQLVEERDRRGIPSLLGMEQVA